MSEEKSLVEVYGAITEAIPEGLEAWSPEDFRPGTGRVLLVRPPAPDRIGAIHLPDVQQVPPSYGRVVAVPEDKKCPCKVGEWVLFRSGAGEHLNLAGRKDLVLVDYADGLSSDILGVLINSPDLVRVQGEVNG